MADGIYVALAGTLAQSTTLETTSTNLANASTDGYQRLRPVFREVLANAGRKGTPEHFVTVASTAVDTSRGTLRVTGRPLDIALADKTFLAVTTPRGERYTRAGALGVAADGTLQTYRGDVVTGEDGKPIKMRKDEPGELKVSPSGEVLQGDNRIGRLRIVSFARPDQLTHEGGTLLAAPAGAAAPTPSGARVEVGSLEESNASVVGAMTDLVSASRTFEAFQRVIDAFRDADRKVVTTVPDVPA